MAHAYTTHRIVKHGDDRMVLSDCATGEGLVEAVREGNAWRLKAEGVPDRTVSAGDTRDAAVTAMNKLAFELSPAPWISIKEPHQVVDEDNNTLHIRDEQ